MSIYRLVVQHRVLRRNLSLGGARFIAQSTQGRNLEGNTPAKKGESISRALDALTSYLPTETA